MPIKTVEGCRLRQVSIEKLFGSPEKEGGSSGGRKGKEPIGLMAQRKVRNNG